jgi:hypothetical protein
MKRITGIERVEKVIGHWSPRDLAIIERLEIMSGRDSRDSILTLDALFQPRTNSWPDFGARMYRVAILFDAVGGLRLRNFGGGPVQIMGFDIHFVGDRGMDRVNYQVEDYEDDRISFVCRGVSVLSASLLDD